MEYTPMLLEKTEEPFDDERFIYEPKIDGHRILPYRRNGSLRLYTKQRVECTRQYPELQEMPTDDELVLDGEVCRIGPDGGIDFESVMQRFLTAKAGKIRSAAASDPVHVVVFDILERNGRDLRGLPLLERKQILRDSLGTNAYYSHSMVVPGEGKRLFEVIQERKMEGIVAKRADSLYVGRRSEHWQKIINYTYATVQLSGYHKDQFGWLAQYQGRPVGVIELAVPAVHRQAFYKVAGRLKTGEDRDNVYLEPRISARVRFRNWTSGGMLRSPEFLEFVI
ncbi:putative DNA ligase-like protein [compost metagenome]